MANVVASLFPDQAGFLPKWLVVVSLISVLNSAQAYSTLKFTQRVYAANPASVTALSARTFGTWTFLSSIIRIYAAYNINQPIVYQLAVWTYAIALFHFLSEWLVYKTAKWGAGLAGPAFVATGSLFWMLSQQSYYVASY